MSEFNLIEIIDSWEKLHTELKKNKKIDFDIFNKTFTQTYALLKPISTSDTLDKKYVELISNAFLFANNISNDIDGKCRAILTLTERMINCYAFRCSSEIPEGTNIYILDSRKDVYLDFNDVDESINKLEKLFNESFWKNL